MYASFPYFLNVLWWLLTFELIRENMNEPYHNIKLLLMNTHWFTCRSHCWNMWVFLNEEGWVRDARQLAGQWVELLGRGADDWRETRVGRHVGQLENATGEGGWRRGARAEVGVLRRGERGVADKRSQFNILLSVVVLVFLLLLLLFFRHLGA